MKLETYLEALDLREAAEEDYEVPLLPNNPTLAQTKNHEGRETKKSKAKACLLQFQQPFTGELCLSKQQKLFAIISRKSMPEMKGNKRHASAKFDKEIRVAKK